jgi:NADPH:quinone reductase-like Zn-dependent oxidoreductase
VRVGGDDTNPWWRRWGELLRRTDGQGFRSEVLASAGTHNQDTLRELGVDVTIDYTSEDVFQIALDDTAEAGVDAAFDTVGGDLIFRSIQSTRVFGRLASITSV